MKAYAIEEYIEVYGYECYVPRWYFLHKLSKCQILDFIYEQYLSSYEMYLQKKHDDDYHDYCSVKYTLDELVENGKLAKEKHIENLLPYILYEDDQYFEFKLPLPHDYRCFRFAEIEIRE